MKSQPLMNGLMIFIGLPMSFGLPVATAQPPQHNTKPVQSATVKLDLSRPEATIESFAMALQKGDAKGAISCVSGAKMSPVWQDWMRMVKQDEEQLSFPILALDSNQKVEIQGDKALVTQQIECRLEGNDWKIVPLTPERFEDAKKPSLLMIATLLAHPEVLTVMRDQARSVACLSNMKQLALAMIMMAQDHDDKFAFAKMQKEHSRNKNAAKWTPLQKAIHYYVKSPAIFHCNADAENAVSYSFNQALDNIAQGKIAKPAETVLLYEGKGGQLDFKHDGRASVAFADGSAARVTAAEAKTLRWKP